MSETLLTSGQDVVGPLVDDQIVRATSSSLNNTDQLDAGAGNDSLQLTGSGNFDLNALAQFSGFEEVVLTNITSDPATLTLKDGANLKVTLNNGASTGVYSPSYFTVNLSTGLDRITG